MSTYTASAILQNASTTQFRAWGSLISTGLSSIGMVQTTDTGQINWSTVTVPGNATYAGYEIWRFADTLQATKPVFVKVEYGTYTTSTGVASSIRISVSNATNGAGVLNGTVTSTTYVIQSQYVEVSTVVKPFYFCGDLSSMVFTMPTSTDAGGFRPSLFMVERSRNGDGTPNGDGIMFSMMQGYGWKDGTSYGDSYTQVLSFLTVAAGNSLRYLPIACPGAFGYWDTSGLDGNTANYFPYLAYTPKVEAQALSLLGCYAYAQPQLVTVSTLVNGASHTYLSLGSQCYASPEPGPAGSGANSVSGYGTNVQTCSLLMRYE